MKLNGFPVFIYCTPIITKLSYSFWHDTSYYCGSNYNNDLQKLF